MKLEQILPLLREKGGKVTVKNRLMWGTWNYEELKYQVLNGVWHDLRLFDDDIFEYVAPPLKDHPKGKLTTLSLMQLTHIFAIYGSHHAKFAGFAVNFGFDLNEVRHWMENQSEYKL